MKELTLQDRKDFLNQIMSNTDILLNEFYDLRLVTQIYDWQTVWNVSTNSWYRYTVAFHNKLDYNRCPRLGEFQTIKKLCEDLISPRFTKTTRVRVLFSVIKPCIVTIDAHVHGWADDTDPDTFIMHLPLALPPGFRFCVNNNWFTPESGKLFGFRATDLHGLEFTGNMERVHLLMTFDMDWEEALKPYIHE